MFHRRWFVPLLLFLMIIPAFFFMLKPGIYWNMHDDMQIIRQLEMEKCLKDGQIPCRWTPDLGYGYGYPLFNFYPPLPYFVGQVFRTLGFSFVTTVKLTAATQIISAAFAMYLLASMVFGPWGGLVSALFYTYAPYHAVNIYVRGAMNEAWASVFFPLIFYFAKKVIDQNRWIYSVGLGFSFAGMMLSHNPMTLIFTPTLCIWILFWLFTKFKFQFKKYLPLLLKLVGGGLIAFGLSAFFTLPVLFESKTVQIESMFTNYYHFSVHFASFYQLFISHYWGDGPSVWGTEDQMSFAIGYLQWGIPTLVSFYLLVKLIRHHRLTQVEIVTLIVFLMGLFSAFMSHERSTPLWLILSPIQKIQFPWRFLNLTTFLLSFSAGLLPLALTFKNIKINVALISLTLILLFSLNLTYFWPLHSGPITDNQKLSGKAWVNQITSGIYDYLPKTARIAALGPAHDYIDDIIPSSVKYQITGAKKGTDWQFFNLYLDKSATIYLSNLAFPDFKVYLNNQLSSYQIEPELGRISLNLDAGNHQIYLKLHNTTIRTIGNSLSLLTLVFLGLYFLSPLIWKHKT